MGDRTIKQLDTLTGELMDGCLVYVPRKVKFRMGWFMMFQDMLLDIAKDREITGEIYRVLLYLPGQSRYVDGLPKINSNR